MKTSSKRIFKAEFLSLKTVGLFLNIAEEMPAVKDGFVVMTEPDKPNSRNQRYKKLYGGAVGGESGKKD